MGSETYPHRYSHNWRHYCHCHIHRDSVGCRPLYLRYPHLYQGWAPSLHKNATFLSSGYYLTSCREMYLYLTKNLQPHARQRCRFLIPIYSTHTSVPPYTYVRQTLSRASRLGPNCMEKYSRTEKYYSLCPLDILSSLQQSNPNRPPKHKYSNEYRRYHLCKLILR